jgi:hypothetical protein
MLKLSRFLARTHIGNSAAGFGERVRTAIQTSFCGANGGWSFALNFCFFLFKQKENNDK